MEAETKLYINSHAETLSRNLKNALHEMEEMVVHLELGKLEAAHKFEELKNELSTKLIEWKQMYSQLKQFDPAKAELLKATFENLKEQLSLGKAATKEFFYEQSEKILHALLKLENEVNSHSQLSYYLSEFKLDVEIFKLKLQILKLKFELKKFVVKDIFRNEIKVALKEIDNIFSNATDKIEHAKSKFSDFKDEVDLSFNHLKRAVNSIHA